VRLDQNKRGVADLMRPHHPALKLGGQRRFAFAVLPPHDGVARVVPSLRDGPRVSQRLAHVLPQQPLEREQFPAAPDEAGCRFFGQPAEARRQAGPQILLRLRCGRAAEELRGVLFLEEHGDKPVFEAQFARAEDTIAKGVVFQAALPSSMAAPTRWLWASPA
jgi:hypothetical protein